MTWNHRIIKHKETNTHWFAIHEVYYENGEPTTVTVDPIAVIGDTPKEIKDTLNYMFLATEKPVLDYEDFEPGGKYHTDTEEIIGDLEDWEDFDQTPVAQR